MARALKDKVIDKLLSSYIINECDQTYGVFLSETKLQKLVFLSEKRMIDNRIKAFNYNYIKFFHGPFSSSLRYDLQAFAENSLILEPYLRGSEKLRWIVEDFQNIFENNERVTNIINAVLRRYAIIPTETLLKIVYNMPWSRKRTIGDLPLKTKMLWPLKIRNDTRIFNISKDDYEDLVFCFDKKIVHEFSKAVSDMREGRIIIHDGNLQ